MVCTEYLLKNQLLLTYSNKNSNDMRKQIEDILNKYDIDGTDQDLMTSELLILYGVSQQRELLLAYNEEVNKYIDGSQGQADESNVDDFLANNYG